MRKVNPPCYAQTQSLLTTWFVSTTMTSWQKPNEIGSYAQPVWRIGPQQTRRESPPPTVLPLYGTSSAALSAAPPSRGNWQQVANSRWLCGVAGVLASSGGRVAVVEVRQTNAGTILAQGAFS